MAPLGEQANLATNQMAHGRLLLAAGEGAQAAALSKAAAVVLHQKHAFDDEVTARVLWANALRAQLNLTEAQQVMEATAPLARTSENPRSHIRWTVESARLQAKAGRTAQALEALEPVIADAHRLGLLRLELEARLAQGEIQLASGQRKKGLATLQAANKDATAHGLQRLARLTSTLPRD
jgi:tetratricopeptide (TPR) repeat protein